MMRWQQWAAVAVAVLAAGATQAQEQRQRQQGGRGMGQQQSLYVLALTNEDLQKELKMTDDQKKGLREVTERATNLAKKRQEAFGGGQPDREKMQEVMKEAEALTADAKAAVEKAATDDQKKRIKQIEVQQMGLRAFANEDVVKAMKFTDDQKAKMKTVTEEYTKASADLRTEYGMGGRPGGGERPSAEKMAEYTKKAAALTTETMDKVKKELTDDQKKAWEDMTGPAFDVSKLQARPMRRDN
jgi:hypothetical protein